MRASEGERDDGRTWVHDPSRGPEVGPKTAVFWHGDGGLNQTCPCNFFLARGEGGHDVIRFPFSGIFQSSMFSTRSLFQSVSCPRKTDCNTLCPFSHTQPSTHTLLIATPDPPKPVAKRPLELTAPVETTEPPPQRIRTAAAPKPVTPVHTQLGAPVLRVNAAQSQVALPVRQVRDAPSPYLPLTAPHRPCSRASTTTFSSSMNTSCLQIRPSHPSMPSARKNRYTRTRQSSPIAMCAFTPLVSPLSSLLGSHKLDRFPQETSHPHLHRPPLRRNRRRHRGTQRSTQQDRRSSSHPPHSHTLAHVHRYHATVALCH